MLSSCELDPSQTWVDDGRTSSVEAKVITPVRVASERKAEGNSMAARGSGGLLAMPVLAATPADRGECCQRRQARV
jgi:hypothetical protein